MSQEISRQTAGGISLREIFLVAARTGWIILAVNILILMYHNLPGFFDVLRTPCENCNYLTFETARALRNLGFTPDEFAAVDVIFEAGFVAIWWGVPGLIFWRKANDWLGLITSFGLMTFGLSFSHWFIPVEQRLYRIIMSIGLCTFVPLLYLFPNGRFVPSWTRWLCYGWLVWTFTWFVLVKREPGDAFWTSYIGMLSLGLVCQFYRYFTASSVVQKWQTKWVVYGITLAVLAYLAFLAPDLVFSANGHSPFAGSFYRPVGAVVFSIVHWYGDLPPTIPGHRPDYPAQPGLASLTALLALLYLGLSIVLTQLAHDLLGPTSQVGIVVSTLAVVALIAPLRRRIQWLVDRRFHRQNIQAERALDDFSVATRDEVDLSHLEELLICIVDDTVQPESAALWLRRIE